MNKKFLTIITIMTIGMALFLIMQLPGSTIKPMNRKHFNKNLKIGNHKSPALPANADSGFYAYYQQVNSLKAEVKDLKKQLKDNEKKIRTMQYKIQYLFDQLQQVKEILPDLLEKQNSQKDSKDNSRLTFHG